MLSHSFHTISGEILEQSDDSTQTMVYSILCPQPDKEKMQKESSEAVVPMPCQQQVVVETVTDQEETEDLLPATADTLQNARNPPPRGVVYMFPRAWKERTSLGRTTEETESSSSYYSQYCTIS